jgi:hypothetical protein
MAPLSDALKLLGLHHTAEHLDDLVALATTRRWSPTQLLEHLADVEQQERARRSLERRLLRSRLGRITPMEAFDWAWPTRWPRLRPSRLDLSAGARRVYSAAPGGSWPARPRPAAYARQIRGTQRAGSTRAHRFPPIRARRSSARPRRSLGLGAGASWPSSVSGRLRRGDQDQIKKVVPAHHHPGPTANVAHTHLWQNHTTNPTDAEFRLPEPVKMRVRRVRISVELNTQIGPK